MERLGFFFTQRLLQHAPKQLDASCSSKQAGAEISFASCSPERSPRRQVAGSNPVAPIFQKGRRSETAATGEASATVLGEALPHRGNFHSSMFAEARAPRPAREARALPGKKGARSYQAIRESRIARREWEGRRGVPAVAEGWMIQIANKRRTDGVNLCAL